MIPQIELNSSSQPSSVVFPCDSRFLSISSWSPWQLLLLVCSPENLWIGFYKIFPFLFVWDLLMQTQIKPWLPLPLPLTVRALISFQSVLDCPKKVVLSYQAVVRKAFALGSQRSTLSSTQIDRGRSRCCFVLVKFRFVIPSSAALKLDLH